MGKVNHPDHYNQLAIECIEVVRHFNFNRGNAIKYIWRAGLKGDAVEDLEKAIWYLRDEIDRIKPSEKQIISIQGREKGTHSIRYNDGTTKTIETEPENLPAATPPQQENSQQEESSPDTPEKQEEGLRNDSGKKTLDVDSIQRELYKKMPEENKTIWEKKHEASLNGKVKAEEKQTLKDVLPGDRLITEQILDALAQQGDWINGRDLTYKLGVKNSYTMVRSVQAELARLFAFGKVKRQKGKGNVYEYMALSPEEMPEPLQVGRPPDPDSTPQRILAYLKETGKAMTSNELADEFQVEVGYTAKILRQYYSRSQIKRKQEAGRYLYFLNDAEPAQLEHPASKLSPNAQTVLDTLTIFGGITPYKHICEAVDLEEIEVTKAIKELKVAKLITSPKIMNYKVVS